jgi:cell division protein FtsA
MSNRKTITAIDVGTTKICTAIADVDESNHLQIVGLGLTPSKGMHKGLVVNINDAKEAIIESIRKAEQTSNRKVESAYIGVTGRHVTSTNNKGAISVNHGDKLVRPDDLRRVLASAQSVKVPKDRKLLHVIPRSYGIDGQQVGLKNPVGMHGYRVDVETHIITAAVNSVQNLIKCIRAVGIDIDDLVLEPLASSEAVLSEDEKQMGVILADIGGGTTDIAMFRDGSIWHTAILPVAGYQLTRDVAIGLGLSFEVAEELKKKYGSVMPIYDSQVDKSKPVSLNGHGVSYQDLCDIIRARVEEILKLIVLELPGSEYRDMFPAGLVLTGGSSNLSGIDALGRDLLRMPVRIGVPNIPAGIGDNLHDPAFATGIGLLYWGAKHDNKSSWRSRFFGVSLLRLVSRIRNLFR